MKHTVTLTALLLLSLSVLARPPEPQLVQAITAAITNLCPEAKIETTAYAFTAKYSTMVYMVHSRSKTGEVYPQTHQEEGPGFRGFMLRVSLEDGKYEGAACVPATLQGPYYPTFIDAPSTDAETKHYQVHFSYGAKLDPKLKEAIFEVIPKTRFQPAGGSYGAPAAGAPSAHP